MRKKLIIGLSALIALLGLAFVLVLLNINPIVQRLRPQIEALLSEKIGQPVAFDSLSVSLLPSTQLQLDNFRLASSTENRIGTLALKTSVLELMRGSLEIEQLYIENARLHVTRKSDGRFYIDGLALSKNLDRELSGQVTFKAVALSNTAAEAPSDVALNLHSLEVRDVHLSFEDALVAPPQTLNISDLEGSVKNIAPQTDGSVDLSATFLSARKQNLRVSGSLSLGAGPLGLPMADLAIQLKELDLEKVQSLAQSYSKKKNVIELKNTASINIRLQANKAGYRIGLDPIDLTETAAQLGSSLKKASGFPLRYSAQLQPYLNGSVQTTASTLTLGKNEISLPFTYKANKELELELRSEEISLENLGELLPALKALLARGILVPDLKVKQNSRKQLNADGSISLREVRLEIPAKQKPLSIESLNGSITLKDKQASSKTLRLKVAEQQLTLNFLLQNFQRPLLDWTVQSEKLFLAPLLEPFSAPAAGLKEAFFDSLKLEGKHDQGKQSGTATISFARGEVSKTPLGKGSFPLSYALEADKSLRALQLKPSSLSAFGGTLNIQAQLQDQQLRTKLNLKDMQLEPISKAFIASSPFQLLGTLTTADIAADLLKSSPKTSTRGPLSLDAIEGELQGFNLLRETFGRLGGIPGVSESLDKYFPPEYQEVLSEESTKFDSIALRGAFAGASIDLKSVDLIHTLYQLRANGSAGFDGRFDLKAQLLLTPALTEKMVLRQPKLELLLDENRNIVIPLVIRKAERIMVLPDIGDLGKRAMKNTAKEAIGKELDKVTPGLGKALEGLLK